MESQLPRRIDGAPIYLAKEIRKAWLVRELRAVNVSQGDETASNPDSVHADADARRRKAVRALKFFLPFLRPPSTLLPVCGAGRLHPLITKTCSLARVERVVVLHFSKGGL